MKTLTEPLKLVLRKSYDMDEQIQAVISSVLEVVSFEALPYVADGREPHFQSIMHRKPNS